MLVDLGLGALKSIVKDGVKEMLSQVAGSGQGCKKRGFFRVVKEGIKEYQKTMEEDFLPVLVQDFSGGIVVRFSGGKMSVEDKNKIRLFMDMVAKSDLKRLEEELVKKVDALKDECDDEANEKFEKNKRVLVEGHGWIVKRLDLHIRSVIGETMYEKTVERSKIEVMLYNFVDSEVSQSVKKLFENGMGSVPSTKMTKKEVDIRVEEALLEYLMRLGRRRIHGTAVVQASGVKDWISKVKRMSIAEEARNWVEEFENYYPALLAELDLYSDVCLETKDELIKRLDKEDCILVMCDKNMGMSLFKLETMRKADQELMNQLGAVKIDNTKEEIIEHLRSEIYNFENGLNKRQEDYLDHTYEGRDCDMKDASFPFLKSLHKVHFLQIEY